MKLDQIAVQLYTLRSLTQNDLLGTLRQLSAAGYRAVEFAGYAGSAPKEIRAVLDECGLVAASAHVSLAEITARPEAIAEELQTLGASYAVVPWLPEELRGSVAATEQVAEQLNTADAKMQAAGLRLAYHNHAFEFETLAGRTMWERLLAATDPALVDFELDVFWAVVGQHDPVEVIKRDGARLGLLHLKDQPATAERPDAPVGSGVLPWADILAAARATKVQWYIVEQDHPQDALAEVTQSLRTLEGWAVS